MNGIELLLVIVWLAVGIPTAIEFVRRRRRRKNRVEEVVGCQTGCFFVCVLGLVLGAILIVVALVQAEQFERPERMLERYLGISNPEDVQDLRTEFIDMTFDHVAYLYFEAPEELVRDLIRDRSFVLETSRFSGGGREFAEFEAAPGLPSGADVVVYRRVGGRRGTVETLVTDRSHRRVWFALINY